MFHQAGLAKTIRPFSSSALVFCRCYSRPLQRRITDFGADHSFETVASKMKEHYGIRVPTSSTRNITQHHAHKMYEKEKKEETPAAAIIQSIILAETDGSMIPIVGITPKPANVDKYDSRKHKQHFWREARLSLAHPIGSITPIFAATLGDVEEVGRQLQFCVKQCGYNEKTNIHCIGDGATWISNQVESKFGSQATYLVDFYHVCDYLSDASSRCSGEQNKKEWMETQKNNLKSGLLDEVFKALVPYLEDACVEDSNAPVRRCHRYLDNRRDQLNYHDAIAKGLPIGSGEIESAHRYVIQKRLKISGAWWKEVNAADMLALRINRANQNWGGYWATSKAA